MLDNYIDGSDVMWQHVKRYKNKVSVIKNGNLPFENDIFHAISLYIKMCGTLMLSKLSFELFNDIFVLPFC